MTRLLLFILTGATLLAQPPRYILHDLGPIGDNTINYPAFAVTGINIRCQVVGYETLSEGNVRAFRTAPNSPINWLTDDLGSLGGTITRARGINASGQVVGESTLSTSSPGGFRTAPDKPIQPATDNIGTLDPQALATRALAINDSGQVTGISGTGFLTAPNSPINPATDTLTVDIVSDTGIQTEGLSVNKYGHVLGDIYQAFGYQSAFVHLGRAQPLYPGFVKFSWENYTGINDHNQVVGGGSNLTLRQNGKKTPLATCPTDCIPVALNNGMQVLIVSQTNPILFTGGTLYDLPSLIQNGSGWTLPYGPRLDWSYRINDLGQIAGVGILNNQTHAVRLDPIPSVPSAISKTMNLLSWLHPNLGRRTTLPLMTKFTLASELNDALTSWNQGNPAATRGFLNEFESLVRTQAGQSLTAEQANQLLDLAEAAIGLT